MLKNISRSILILTIAITSSFFSIAQAEDKMVMILEVASPLGFEETIEKVIANAKELGWKVPRKWKKKFQKNLLKQTGVDVGKNLVLKMCEPHAAAEMLVHDEYKRFLATMPCSVAIYVKSDGKTYISMMNLNLMGTMYGGKMAKLAEKLSPQMEKMLKME